MPNPVKEAEEIMARAELDLALKSIDDLMKQTIKECIHMKMTLIKAWEGRRR